MRLSTLGLISVIASAFAAPAFAGTPASISGSATFSTPAGFTSTVSGESVLPSGFVYSTLGATLTTAATPADKDVITDAAVIVVPNYNLQGFSIATTSLSVGSSAAPTAAPGTSFSATAATVLAAAAAAADPTLTGAEFIDPISGARIYNSSNIEFIAAIIKAGAGVNGLD
jgi:hypothetical protein